MTEPIRPATADDAPACAAILSAWLTGTDWMEDGPSEDELEPILRQGLPMRDAYVIGDPVVGYISVEAEIDHIWGFYIATPGRGLGPALLDHVKKGRTFLSLNTHAPNTAAHAFYAREGFAKTGAPWRGEDGVDEIRMEWRT